jgi:TPR repeat protein
MNRLAPSLSPLFAVIVLISAASPTLAADPERGRLDKNCNAGKAADCVSLAFLWAEGDRGPEDPKKALALFEKACDLKEARGCFEAARYCEAGVHIPANVSRALSLFDTSCALGHGESCRTLGSLHASGSKVPADPVRARAAFEAGCRASDGISCFEAGTRLLRGLGGDRDEASARARFQSGCDAKDARSCVEAGAMYRDGLGGPKDTTRAKTSFELACTHGGERFCNLDQAGGSGETPLPAPRCAGSRCEKFEFVPYVENISKIKPSLEFFRTKCDANEAKPCFKLAAILAAEDPARGLEAYRRACTLGSTEGCVNLGVLTLGKGQSKERALAEPHLQTACDKGDALGCYNRALLHVLAGQDSDAFQLAIRACDGNEPLACHQAGVMLELGLGTPKDEAAARTRFEAACNGGVTEACP